MTTTFDPDTDTSAIDFADDLETLFRSIDCGPVREIDAEDFLGGRGWSMSAKAFADARPAGVHETDAGVELVDGKGRVFHLTIARVR